MDWNRLRNERLAVIADLCARAPGGSLGRTALMKLCYFLQVLKGVPLGYHFTLYSYGPFDSDVLSDLGTAESLGAVRSAVVYYPGGYGFKIQPADLNDKVAQRSAEFLHEYRGSLDWVLAEFGSLGSANLELQSTIVFVDREARRQSEILTTRELAKRVREVKPHFQEYIILENVDRLLEKALLQSVRPITAAA